MWAQNTVPGVILDVEVVNMGMQHRFFMACIAGLITLRAFRNRQNFNLGPIRSYSVLCRTGLGCPQLHFRYIEAYDDEGHAGWVPTLSFEFTNEDGNVEEQTGTLAEVREWCDLGCIPED